MQENEEIKKTGKKSDNAKKASQKTVSSKKEKVEKTKENSTRKNNKSKASTTKIKKDSSNSTNKTNEKKSTNSEKKEKKRNSSISKAAKKTSVKGNEKKEKESAKKEKEKDTVKSNEKKSDIKDKVTKEVKSRAKNVKENVKKAEIKNSKENVKKAETKTKKSKENAKKAEIETKNSKEKVKKAEVKAKDSKENVKKIKTKDSKETTKKAETNNSKDIAPKTESKKSSVKNVAEENISKNKIDQVVVIEKIRDFISKVVAMQEEAKKEIIDEKTKVSAKKESKPKVPKKEYIIEYYDLPYRYNETIVKILAQTPKKLFVYWDISDNDRNKYIETFGENFFETTYPVLLLYNEDKQYVKEVAINDFANSWYIDIDDPKTKYTIQLGRKFKNPIDFWDTNKLNENNIIIRTDYLPFANSNLLEVPNDHVLLEQLPEFIVFRNVKTNSEIRKDIRSLKDIFGNNYDVREFYEDQYKDELKEGMFDMDNPSSNMTSSMFK